MVVLSNDSTCNKTTIDCLPDCLIQHIFFFLPTIDAIKTSLVCRKWLNLWHHISVLSFDIVPFHSPSNSYPTTRKLFSKFVNWALHIRPLGSLHKFHVRIDCSDYGDYDNLTSWIEYAITSGVTELDLDLDTCDLNTIQSEEYLNGEVMIVYEPDDYTDYVFNFSCLINSSVKVLKFHKGGCEFPLLPPVVRPTDITSLLSLTLDDVSFKGGDDEFARLVQSCVNLEDLTIYDCFSLKHINILSSKLKTCKIGSVRWFEDWKTSLVISSPCLHSLSLSHILMENDLLKGSPHLVKAEVNFRDRILSYYGWWCNIMRSLTSVKCLIVQNMYFGQEYLESEEMLQCYNFNNLSNLELHTGYSGTDVKGICLFLKHAPVLESMVIDYCDRSSTDEDEGIITEDPTSSNITLYIPCLQKVKMMNYRGTKGELHLVELLKAHKSILEEVVAFPVQFDAKMLKPFTLWKADEDEHLGVDSKHRRTY